MPPASISVITATWNLIEHGRQDRFKQAVTCIRDQACPGLEHVIQDGASSDGTPDLIRRVVGEDAATIVVSAPDTGLYDAMNRAVERASGEYVLFLNSDDSLASPTILKDLQRLIGQDRPDFVFGGSLQTLPDGTTRVFSRTNLAAFLQRMPFCHNSMLLRRSVFLNLGGHDLSYKVASDYDFVFRMLCAGYQGRDARMPISLYSDRGVSGDSLAVAQDYARVWSLYFGQLTGQGPIDPEICLDWYRRGQLPVSMCLAALRNSKGVALVRRAALHSLKITLRRKAQPWRRWENLGG